MPSVAVALKPERIADGHDHVANAHLVRIADGNRGQIGLLDLDDGNICSDVAPDQFRQHAPAVRQANLDARGILDDMIVGENIAVAGVNDDAGAAGPKRVFLRGCSALAFGLPRQELDKLVRFAGDPDGYDSGNHLLEDRRKRADGAARLRRIAPGITGNERHRTQNCGCQQ